MNEKRGKRQRTPVEVVDELKAWLDDRIGNVAEDDWLLLDDFEGHCEAVRREWDRASRVSVANPEVQRELLGRCASNQRLAEAALAAIVSAWLKRR
jgi:hypothetical protein